MIKIPYEEHKQNMIKHFSRPTTNALKNLSFYRSETGFKGIKYINEQLKPNSVLDVGCGMNNFKNVINNLTGIDLIDYKKVHDGVNGADIVEDVFDFYAREKPNFDMIYCVGALNFGNEETICKMLQVFKEIVGPGGRIFGHVRPGTFKNHERDKKFGFYHYPWTKKEIERISKLVGIEVIDMKVETTSLEQMDNDMLREYRNIFLEIGATREPLDNGNIDESIPYQGREQMLEQFNNQYNLRFDKIKFDLRIQSVGIRPRLKVEFVV